MIHPCRILLRRFALSALCVALLGCSTAIKESKELIDQGRWQEGLARLDDEARRNPSNPEPRIQYFRQRDRAFARVLVAASDEVTAGRFDQGEALYREVLAVEKNNPRALAGLESIVAARRHRLLVADARGLLAKGDTISADLMVKGVLTEDPDNAEALAINRELRERERRKSLTPPTLKSRMQNPVNLEFRDAPLKLALEAISRSSGINFSFDRDVKADLKTTIMVKNVRVEDAIDMLLGPNQLEKKILSETTILVYPNTPQKQRENQELVMRAFHLGNADPKQTINLIRTMIKTKDLFVDERVNMLVMRDTPDAIRLAEKLISMQDLADPEVVLELEILEVSRSKVRDLGVSFPTQFTGPGGSSATLASIDNLSRNTIGVNSGYGIRLLRNDGDTKTLANPRVRVRNKEKARVHVGDRVPVISSTLIGTGSGAPVSSEQIQYLDVGIKIDAEPTVYPDDTVAVKINLDVSSLGAQTITNAGTVAYEVGTRNVNTVLRLRDGETQALMGLIREDDVKTRSGLPFLGELPILDRIFGTTKDDNRSRELVLLITPRIVRGTGNPDATLAEFWSGTEANLRARTPFSSPLEVAAKPAAKPAVAAPTAPGPRAVTPPAGPAGAVAAPATSPAPAAETAPADALPVPAEEGVLPPQGSVRLKWSAPASVKAGSEVTASLAAVSDVPLKGVTVNLRYRPLELELLAVEDGGYFKRAGAGSVYAPRVEPTLGMVSVTLGAGTSKAATGEGGLMTLRMRPVTTGSSAKLEIISVVGIDEAGGQVLVSDAVALDLAVER
jgi:general secretion pathway protein D